MSIERSFLRYRNRLEKVFGKKDRDRNEDGKKKIPLLGNRFLLEPLEPRVLLSDATLSIGNVSLIEGQSGTEDLNFTVTLSAEADSPCNKPAWMADCNCVSVQGAEESIFFPATTSVNSPRGG